MKIVFEHVLLTVCNLAERQLPPADEVINLGDTGKVWLTSDILDTLWHRAEVSINQVCFNLYFNQQCKSKKLQASLQRDLGDFSNIKNYLTTRLTPMTPEQREYLHTTRLYYHQVNGDPDKWHRARIRDVHKSRHIHLKGMLAGFTNGMEQLLPPQQNVEFKFTKANERFYINRREDCTDEFKVEIIAAILHVTRVQLMPNLDEAFMARWRRERRYFIPYTRGDVHKHIITPGVMSHTISNVNMSRVPHRITLLFLDHQTGLGGQYSVGI